MGVPGKPPLVPVEVVPPEGSAPSAPIGPDRTSDRKGARTPFHPASATMLLVFGGDGARLESDGQVTLGDLGELGDKAVEFG